MVVGPESRAYIAATDARTLALKLRAEAVAALAAADGLSQSAVTAERLARRAQVEYETRFPDTTGLARL